MTMAIIQKSRGCFLLVARKLDQAVGSSARNTQIALSRRHLPRLACKHILDELQSRAAIRVVFHPLIPSFQGELIHFWALWYHTGLSPSRYVMQQKANSLLTSWIILACPSLD